MPVISVTASGEMATDVNPLLREVDEDDERFGLLVEKCWPVHYSQI